MFVLHSLFEISEYFIQMNNKYPFFYWVISALVSPLLPALLAC